MKRRNLFQAALAAAGLVMLGGCASTTAQKPSPAPAPAVKPAAQKISDEEMIAELLMNERAQALANFAAGKIVEESADDPDKALKALESFTKAALADPKNEKLIEDVCRRYLKHKEELGAQGLQKALDVLDRAVNTPPPSANMRAWQGYMLSQLGRTNDAVNANRAALKIDPKCSFAIENLYELYTLTKNSKEALKLLEDALKPTDLGAEALVRIAEMFTNHRQLHPDQSDAMKERTIATLDRAVTRPTEDLLIRTHMADLYAASAAYAKAEAIYMALLDKNPTLPGGREKLMDLYARSGEKEKLKTELKAYARANRGDAQSLFFLARVAQQAQLNEEAVNYFEQVRTLRPEFRPAYFELARVRMAMDKSEEAIKVLEEARQVFSQDFSIEFFSGLARARMKEYDKAIRHYNEAEVLALASDPSVLGASFYFQLGAAQERNGNFSGAEKVFKKSIEMDPDFAEALNYLGYMYAEKGTNLAVSKIMIEKALKLEPESGAIQDSMAWVFFKLGQPKAALPYLLKAVSKAEDADSTIYDHLGDVYLSLKQIEQARESWQKALKLEATDAIKKKLDGLPPAKK